MALFHEAMLADVVEAKRLDAEFFRPDFTSIEDAVWRFGADPLSTLAKQIKRGIQPIYSEDGDIPVVRTVNVREMGLSGARQEYVSAEFAEANPRGLLRKNDILITSTGIGTLGRVAIHTSDEKFFGDGHITYIRSLKGVDPLYVTAFLQTRMSYALIEKRQRGSSGQMEVYPFDIAAIPIARSTTLEDEVSHKYKRVLHAVKFAEATWRDAHLLLERSLELDKISRTSPLWFEGSAAEAARCRRIDAEFFSPPVQNLLRHLASGGKRLADVAPEARQRFAASPGKAFHYIEISDVDENGTATGSIIDGGDAPSRATWVVREGDIITSLVRPIRRLTAMVGAEQTGHVCSSGFAVLRPRDVAPEVLLVYLRLPRVCELMHMYTTATMYPAIAHEDLLGLPVLLPDQRTQDRVVAKVQEASAARQEARYLLSEIKNRIESAILGAA